MKYKISAVVAVALLAAAIAVVVWISFARSEPIHSGSAHSSASGTSSAPRSVGAHPQPSPSASIVVPTRRVDPLRGGSYCQTAKLLGIYARQSYGLDPDLGVVAGRSFSKRLDVVASTYRRLATQAAGTPEVGSIAARSWRQLASAVEAAGEALKATGYDVQSQVMITKLADVAKATQVHLPRATATLKDACGLSREALGL